MPARLLPRPPGFQLRCGFTRLDGQVANFRGSPSVVKQDIALFQMSAWLSIVTQFTQINAYDRGLQDNMGAIFRTG